MEQPDATLAVIMEWRRKCYEHSGKSNDSLLSLFAKGFDTIAVLASPTSDSASILRALASLESERNIALQFENKDFDVLRYFSFGFIEVFNLLMKIQRENNCEEQVPITNDMNDQISNLSPSHAKFEPFDDYDYDYEMSNAIPPCKNECRDERIDALEDGPTDNQITLDSTPIGDLAEENANESFSNEPVDSLTVQVSSDNPITFDGTPDGNISDRKEIAENILRASIRDDSVEKEENLNGHSNDTPKDFYKKTIEVKKRKMPCRSVSKPVNYFGPQKRRRENVTSPEEEKRKSINRVSKMNDTHLECPECEYRTQCVSGWYDHLKIKNSTNPTLAGLALRCQCGSETYSDKHAYLCDVAKFIVIRKSDGPIRRIGDEKMTPCCVLCENYPNTVYGYAYHLVRHHNSSLKKNSIYLKCSYGQNVHSLDALKKTTHGRECDSCLFTLHKLEEE